LGVISPIEPPFFHHLLHEGQTHQTSVGADDLARERERFQESQRRRQFVAVWHGAVRPDQSVQK
jgi:hypothetical protein